MTQLQIVDYGAGNLRSVVAAVQRLGVTPRIVTTAADVDIASALILPGVGAAAQAMAQLQDKGLDEVLPRCTAPVLGICLGMQLLLEFSEEGDVGTLGIIPGATRKLQHAPKLPHMGWNQVSWQKPCALLKNLIAPVDLYFAHSYYADTQSDYICATTDYGQPIPVVIQKDNFYGIQCHPEKSGDVGMTILKNFFKVVTP